MTTVKKFGVWRTTNQEGGELNLQEKQAEPRVTSQTVSPDSGYNGLSKVRISGVTSAIDSSIQPGNIKQGVSILGVEGTFEGEGGGGNTHTGHVDEAGLRALNWNDSDIAWLKKVVWWDEEDDDYWAVSQANIDKGRLITWQNRGTYDKDPDIRYFPKIAVNGSIYTAFYGANEGWYQLVAVPTSGWVIRDSAGLAFQNCPSLRSIGDMEEVTLVSVTSMQSFLRQTSVHHIGYVGNWDVSHVTNFTQMFSDSKIEELNGLEMWDTSASSAGVQIKSPLIKELHFRTFADFAHAVCGECSSLIKVTAGTPAEDGQLINGANKFYALEELVSLPDLSQCQITANPASYFAECKALAHLTIPSIAPNSSSTSMFNNMSNLTHIIACGRISASIALSKSPMLTRESALVLFDALDANNPGTITLSDRTKAQLSAADKAIATNKGWTIA